MAIDSLLGTRLALPFRNANYGIYTAGNAISLVGTWMQRISVGWLTWQMTHSGVWLGVIAFADFCPVMLVGPIAGAAADRWDRLRVVRTSQVLSLIQASILCAFTALDWMNIWLLVTLTAWRDRRVQPAGAPRSRALARHAGRSCVGGGDKFGDLQPRPLRRSDARRSRDRV